MPLELCFLDQDTAYEHVFERYTLLQGNANELRQDLGIVSRSTHNVQLSFEPHHDSCIKHSFSLNLSQSLTNLNSSASNKNSTTGFVVWSTSPFFLQWLLYSQSGERFIHGTVLKLQNGSDLSIPAIFSTLQDVKFQYVLELGSGVAGVLPVALANYVDKFVCTDQQALLPGLKRNVVENIDEIYLRNVESSTLAISTTRKTTAKVLFDAVPLDWETFNPVTTTVNPLLLPPQSANITIIAMDVVYNDFLISPFLNTLQGLLTLFTQQGHQVRCILGIQLRAQEVLQEFLDQGIDKYKLKVYAIQDAKIVSSRFALYYISL